MSFTATSSTKLKFLLLAWVDVFPMNGHNTVSVLSLVCVVVGDTVHDLVGYGPGHGAATVRCEGDLSVGVTSSICVPRGVAKTSKILSHYVHPWQ